MAPALDRKAIGTTSGIRIEQRRSNNLIAEDGDDAAMGPEIAALRLATSGRRKAVVRAVGLRAAIALELSTSEQQKIGKRLRGDLAEAMLRIAVEETMMRTGGSLKSAIFLIGVTLPKFEHH